MYWYEDVTVMLDYTTLWLRVGVAEKIFVCVFSRKLQTPHPFFVVNYIILL